MAGNRNLKSWIFLPSARRLCNKVFIAGEAPGEGAITAAGLGLRLLCCKESAVLAALHRFAVHPCFIFRICYDLSLSYTKGHGNQYQILCKLVVAGVCVRVCVCVCVCECPVPQ